MKKMRIAAILAALLLLGCGGKEGSDTTASATDQTAQTSAVTTAPAETTAPAADTAPAAEGVIYKNGSYDGIGYGNNGSIRVKIEIAGDKIVQLEVVNHQETSDIFAGAWDDIYAAVMEQETPDLSRVDAVSGATNSSKGIIEAIKAALYKARK